jgi:hypothetical protein
LTAERFRSLAETHSVLESTSSSIDSPNRQTYTPLKEITVVVLAGGLNRSLLSFSLASAFTLVPCLAQGGGSPQLRFEQVPGSLAQISVGADGSVWGVNGSQQIFTYNTSTASWTQIPGALTYVAVGNANAVWGINAQQQIFHWDVGHASWVNVPGSLSEIAVGADGDVWGINYQAIAFHLNPQTGLFEQVPSPAQPPGRSGVVPLGALKVESAGAVYVLGSTASILEQVMFWYNPGTRTFEAVDDINNLGDFAAGVDGSVWATSFSQAHYYDMRSDSFHPTFVSVPYSGFISKLFVGYGGAVFALDTLGNILRWDGTSQTWTEISGNLSSISVGANGDVWGINSYQQIFHLAGTTPRPFQALDAFPGPVDQISVAVDGRAWALNATAVEYLDQLTASFQVFSGAPALAQISAGLGWNVWGVDPSGSIYRLTTALGAPTWTSVPGELKVIQVGADGSVWGVNAVGQTFTYDSVHSTWTNIPGQLGTGPGDLAVGADGTVWGINPDQQIYRYDSMSQSWVYVPGSLVQIAVGNATNIWGINKNQWVYRYDTTAQRWLNIPGALLVQISVAFDGTVWGVNAQGSLYQWVPQAQVFEFAANGITHVAVGNAASVWAINASSRTAYNWF